MNNRVLISEERLDELIRKEIKFDLMMDTSEECAKSILIEERKKHNA